MKHLYTLALACLLAACTNTISAEHYALADSLCTNHAGVAAASAQWMSRDSFEVTAYCKDGIQATKRTKP